MVPRMLRIACAVLLISSSALAGDGWIWMRGDQQVTMSGDLKDLELARKYLSKLGPGYLWFRRGGKQYVVRDQKFTEKVERAVRQDNAANAKEAELEPREAELERQQSKLEKHQAALEAWEDEKGSGETLSREQRKLSRDQEAVNREQEKLAREQEKLGKEEERSARELEKRMAQLIDEALRTHVAQEVN